MNRKTDLRKFQPTTSTGKDVRDTQMISGECKKSAVHNAKNDTSEHTTKSFKDKMGGLGGEASH